MKLNVTVKEWGPSCWKFLINVALRYDEEFNWQQARQFQVFLYQLQYVLPCEKCRHHYHDYLRSNPPNLHTRMELLLWLHKLYNTIKAREGYSKTFDEFMAIGNNYKKEYFWKLMYYICVGFQESTFENQLAYKQFIEYIGYLEPMSVFEKATRQIVVDPYMLNSESMLYWLQLIFMETNKENDIYNNVESSYGKSTVNYRTHSGF